MCPDNIKLIDTSNNPLGNLPPIDINSLSYNPATEALKQATQIKIPENIENPTAKELKRQTELTEQYLCQNQQLVEQLESANQKIDELTPKPIPFYKKTIKWILVGIGVLVTAFIGALFSEYISNIVSFIRQWLGI